MSITKIGSKIYIDGTPASDIGAMITQRSRAKIYRLNEICRCLECKRDKPLAAFDSHKENRRGYFGVCRECHERLPMASGM